MIVIIAQPVAIQLQLDQYIHQTIVSKTLSYLPSSNDLTCGMWVYENKTLYARVTFENICITIPKMLSLLYNKTLANKK